MLYSDIFTRKVSFCQDRYAQEEIDFFFTTDDSGTICAIVWHSYIYEGEDGEMDVMDTYLCVI